MSYIRLVLFTKGSGKEREVEEKQKRRGKKRENESVREVAPILSSPSS
jgi:hypothetical protein